MRVHKVALDPVVVEKVVRRRGRLHVFSDLQPARTALLVVDMQAIYLDPALAEGNSFFVPHYREIVPNINRIADALRKTGGTVVWIMNAVTPESQKSWSVVNERMLSPESRKRREAAYTPDAPENQLWRDLDVKEQDLTVKKTRFSAFIQGSSDIEARLRERGIDTVIITGVGTDACCESTARDAMMLNFATIMVGDANACASDHAHNASLTAFYRLFGDVMSTDELVGFINANHATSK